MNEDIYTDLTEEEFMQAVPAAYRTADFEFVAFALAYRKPEVQVVDIIPYDDPQKRGYKSRRFVFVLVGAGNDADWYKKLEDLAYQYVNSNTVIEPMILGAKRKFLRGLMYNHPSFHGNGEKRKERR